jgi:AcrR family transcriptional regulator
MTTTVTRKRILAAALRLFNESGTAAVSTNHIAAEAGLSPGNLYYHFRNKVEIVRALVEALLEDFDALWLLPQDHALRLEDLQTLIRASFEIQWRYRFFSREQVALLRHDPLLSQRLQENYQRRMRQQKALVQHLTDGGVLRPPQTETELDELLAACWIVNENWLSFLESTGQPVTYEQFQAGSQIIARILDPLVIERSAR